MPYRNRDLLDLARRAPCCFSCLRPNDGTVVAAHRNMGKAMGLKNPDYMVAFMDFACHTFMDQGAALDREDRRAMWEEAYWRTQEWLWTSGHIRIADQPVPHINPPKPPSKKIPKGRSLQSGRKLQGRGFETPAVKQMIPSRGFDKRKVTA